METCQNTQDNGKNTKWLVHCLQSCKTGMDVYKNWEKIEK